MLHGSEDRWAGRNVTRASRLVPALRAAGHQVSLRSNNDQPDGTRFDIVHVFNSWPLETCLPAIKMARRVGACVVFSPIALDLNALPVFKDLLGATLNVRDPQTIGPDLVEICRGISPRTYDGGFVPVEGAAGQFETLRSATELVDHVICLSRHEQNFLRAIGANVSRATIVENSSNYDGFEQAAPDAFRRKYGLDQYGLCVGRLEYRKNQALLAHALRGHQLPLVLIGDYGDPGYGELVRKYSQSNVIYIGPVNDRRLLASAYAGAAALMLPSWAEGASLAALEAGFFGTPLILSTMSSEREYFGDLANYVHPADMAGIRDALQRVLQSPRSKERRSVLTAFTRERYGFVQHAEKTLAVYRKAAAQAAARPDERSIGSLPPGVPYQRAAARIFSEARPGYKDYGIVRRAPRHPVSERLAVGLQNLRRFLFGAARRWLKSRRRKHAVAKFRSKPVGEIVVMEISAADQDLDRKVGPP